MAATSADPWMWKRTQSQSSCADGACSGSDSQHQTPGTKACGRMLSSNKSVLCVVHPHQDSWPSPSGDSWYRFQTSSGKPLNVYPSFTQKGDLGQSMKMGEFTNPIGDAWTGAFANLKSRTSIFRFSHLHRGWWTKERRESCSEMGSFISFVHCIFSISKRTCLPVDAQETFVEWKNREFRNEADPWQVRRGKTVGQCNIEEKGPMLFLSLLPRWSVDKAACFAAQAKMEWNIKYWSFRKSR